MRVGDIVRKLKGYTFTGEVRSVFTNTKGDTRVVVEMLNSGGLLHIFSLTDLVVDPYMRRGDIVDEQTN